MTVSFKSYSVFKWLRLRFLCRKEVVEVCNAAFKSKVIQGAMDEEAREILLEITDSEGWRGRVMSAGLL